MIDERFKTANLRKPLFGGGHGGAQREIDAAQLPGGKHASIEIGSVAERLHLGNERAIRDSAIETSNRANLRIGKRSGNRVQIARRHTNVAIADNQNIVTGLAHHAAKLVHLVAGAELLSADQKTDVVLREVLNELFDNWNGGIAAFRNAKNDFEFRIFLATETGVIFVGFTIQAADWLKHADRRSKILPNFRTILEEVTRGGNGQQIISERAERERQQRPSQDFMPHG